MGRVILFGLDGGTYTVLDSLIDRGVMPFLGRFMKSGARGVLRSTTPPLTPPAWCSLVTGRSPGNHGITGFFQYESECSLVIEIVSATKLHAETLWSIVSRQGKRAGSLNFAVHHPAPRVDGYVIPGWVPWRWLKRLSHPKGLVERLTAEVPGFDVKALAMDFDEEKKSIAGEPVEDPEGWIALHIRRERQWFQVFEHQLKNDPCDLVGIVFDGVDKLQHLLWPYLDRSNLVDLGPNQDRIRSLCFNYFRQIDDFLERTVLMAGPDATVMVVSDHGFTGTSDILFINTWLESRGYLVWNEDAPFVPGGSQELETDFYKLSAFDMSRTRAFALTASSNGINIVVRGRKTERGIAPDEYESFRTRLMNELLTDCVDPETGKPLIVKITPREEAFAGPYMGVAPDLTLTLHDHGFVSVRRSQTITAKRTQVMGTHHPDGILIARGPGIRQGVEIEPVRLIDIAPTALYCMGLRTPEDLEGTKITDMFTPAYLAAHASSTGERTMAAVVTGPTMDGDDADLLERLKALGYLE